MKANELRIGNILDYYGQEVIVLEIKRNNNIEFGYFVDSEGFERKLTEKHSPNPIPLTEEWLLKLGFEDNIGGYYELFDDEEYFLSYDFTNKKIGIYINNTKGIRYWIKCDYVHHIQNLYLDLKQEELQIINKN